MSFPVAGEGSGDLLWSEKILGNEDSRRVGEWIEWQRSNRELLPLLSGHRGFSRERKKSVEEDYRR